MKFYSVAYLCWNFLGIEKMHVRNVSFHFRSIENIIVINVGNQSPVGMKRRQYNDIYFEKTCWATLGGGCVMKHSFVSRYLISRGSNLIDIVHHCYLRQSSAAPAFFG